MITTGKGGEEMQQTTYYQLSEPEYGENPDVALINGNMDVIDTALNKARLRDSDLYNENLTYAIGDFCIYNDMLYRCIDATTGAWDGTKWTQTRIADAFSPKHEWSLFETYTVDTAARTIRRDLPAGVNGIFISMRVEAGSGNAEFGVVIKTTARHSVGDLGSFITTSTGYGTAEYTRDGNLWSGYITQRGSAATASPNMTARGDGFALDAADAEYVEFRTNTSGAVVPSGSRFDIYIRR